MFLFSFLPRAACKYTPENAHGSNKFLIAPLRLRVCCLFSCWRTSERERGGGGGGGVTMVGWGQAEISYLPFITERGLLVVLVGGRRFSSAVEQTHAGKASRTF